MTEKPQGIAMGTVWSDFPIALHWVLWLLDDLDEGTPLEGRLRMKAGGPRTRRYGK
jgi:hypothetical protein